MNNPSGNKWMQLGSKVCWLFFLTAGLMAILSPRPTLAQERQIDLTLRLFSRGSYNEVITGKDNSFYLEISNIGNKAITGIKLSADIPEDWVIDFKMGKIDYLGPGSLQTIDVNIKPPENVSGGQYGINIIAEANEIRKIEKFWVTVKTTSVKTASLWLWVGAGIALIVVAGFIIIFLRFGRQKSRIPDGERGDSPD